jgi:hypothetical protein
MENTLNWEEIYSEDIDGLYDIRKDKSPRQDKQKSTSSRTRKSRVKLQPPEPDSMYKEQISVVKMAQCHLREFPSKTKVEHSSSHQGQEIDIAEELVNMVKEMTLIPKNGVSTKHAYKQHLSYLLLLYKK